MSRCVGKLLLFTAPLLYSSGGEVSFARHGKTSFREADGQMEAEANVGETDHDEVIREYYKEGES